MKVFIFLMLSAMIFTGCVTFHDDPNTSIWSGYAWIPIPILAAGILIFGYKAYKSGKSNSTQQIPGGPTKQNTGNTKNVGYIFATIFCIGALIWYIVSNVANR